MIDFSVLDRHERIAMGFSGGKDSTACVYLLQDHLDRIKIYNLDTGDLLPEMYESIARVEAWAPHFVRIKTDVTAWIGEHGLPTDLLPYSAHPVGQAMGEQRVKLVSRYTCCWENLMWPFYERVRADGNTLLIRGTKRVDMPRLPMASGDVCDGIELFYPIQEWSNDQVFAYLDERGVQLPRLYQTSVNSPECARCTAWLGEGRARYLRQYHPKLYAEYDDRLQHVIDAIAPSLALLRLEAGG